MPKLPDIDRFLPPPPDEIIGLAAEAGSDALDLVLMPFRALSRIAEKAVGGIRRLAP